MCSYGILQDIDDPVYRRNRNGEIVAHGLVAFGHERSEPSQIAFSQSGGCLNCAQIFANHMACAAVRDGVELCGNQHVHVCIAQGGHAHGAGGCFALAAAFVIVAVHQTPGDAGMHDHDGEIIGDGRIGQAERPAIDQQCMPGFALCRDKLVHDPTFGADKIAFRGLGDPGEMGAINFGSRQSKHRLTDSDLQRG